MIQVSWGEMTPAEIRRAGLAGEGPLKRVILEVCRQYGLTYAELLSKQRGRKYSRPRQEAYWRCSKETGASLPEIGMAFGNRDHTTVLFGIRAHEKRMGAAHGA